MLKLVPKFSGHGTKTCLLELWSVVYGPAVGASILGDAVLVFSGFLEENTFPF